MPYLGNEVAPLVQALEGKELKLDSDGDSSIQASTDDQIDIKISGADDYKFTANNFTALDSSNVVFGTGNDAKIFHDGNNTKFQHTGTGGLYVGADAFYITNGATDTNHISVDSNGHVTMPKQPAFQVHPASTSQSNISINTDHTITLDTERFDQNGDFASNTFTAPVTGKYQLNLTLYVTDMPPDTAYVETYVITSNKTYYAIVDSGAYDQDHSYFTFSTHVLADMDANDTCTIAIRQSGGSVQMDIKPATNFSGYLVC